MMKGNLRGSFVFRGKLYEQYISCGTRRVCLPGEWSISAEKVPIRKEDKLLLLEASKKNKATPVAKVTVTWEESKLHCYWSVGWLREGDQVDCLIWMRNASWFKNTRPSNTGPAYEYVQISGDSPRILAASITIQPVRDVDAVPQWAWDLHNREPVKLVKRRYI